MRVCCGRFWATAAAVVALAVGQSEARADVIVYGFGSDSKTQAGMFPQFDPRLGFLREVDMSLSVTASSSYRYFVNGDNVFAPISGTGGGRVMAIFIFPDQSVSGVLSVSQSGFPISGDHGILTVAVTGSVATGIPITSQSNPYVGTGTIRFQVGGFASFDSISTPGVTFDFSHVTNFAAGGGTVTYVYSTTSAPEPSSLVLGALAMLIGLGYAGLRSGAPGFLVGPRERGQPRRLPAGRIRTSA
jgi:hypothetical protein